MQNQIHKIIYCTKANISKRQSKDSLLSIINLENMHEAPQKDFYTEHLEKPLHGNFLKNMKFKDHSFTWLLKTNVRKDIKKQRLYYKNKHSQQLTIKTKLRRKILILYEDYVKIFQKPSLIF